MAAIRALEARSLEFMHEKEEKKRLEQRIAMLMGQMIRGERSPGDGSNGVSNSLWAVDVTQCASKGCLTFCITMHAHCTVSLSSSHRHYITVITSFMSHSQYHCAMMGSRDLRCR